MKFYRFIYDILFCGRSVPFNIGTELVAIGNMFGFLKDENGQVAISNRIFEIWFYNLFIAEEALGNATYSWMLLLSSDYRCFSDK